MSSSDWSRKRARQGEEKGGEEGKLGEPPGPPGPPRGQGQVHPGAGAPRLPPGPGPGPGGPQGYYQPVYPPAGQEPGPPQYPPQRGYENAGYPGQYNVPPPGYPYMPPYGMYPPYQHPMYGGPPPVQHGGPSQGPPPPYGYQDPNMPDGRYANPEGYGQQQMVQQREDDRKMSARSSTNSSRAEGDGDDDGTEEDSNSGIVPGAVTARLKTYIKPRIPSTQEVLDRRSRKNAQSRARAAKLRHRISEIETKEDDGRTEEEKHLWAQYESRRQRKNDRSRERALEKKEEIDRILAKPDKKRTKIERQFLETALSAKKRKNEGDRLRRQRLKELGLSTKGSGVKPGISARGPLPPQYQHMAPPPGYGHQHGHGHMQGMGMGMGGMGMGMGDIPMSPLPAMPHHHHHHLPMQSPGFGSPGMMPNLGYPSPGRRQLGTPGRGPEGMPYFPGAHAYEHASPAQRGHLPMNSRVEQRRNPDGSMSIQIGGRGAGGPAFGGEARMAGGDEQVHMSDVNNLLLDNDNGYEQQGAGGQDSEGKAE
jgi:hypothetical protein